MVPIFSCMGLTYLVGFLLLSAAVGSEEELAISIDLMEEMVTSAELANLVYQEDVANRTALHQEEFGFEYLEAWTSHPDASLVAMDADMGVCYAVFRGTCEEKYFKNADYGWAPDWLPTYDMTPDWKQNLSPLLGNVKGCTVRRGYHDGLYNSYFDQLDASVTRCMDELCPGCRLVLAGHSQGGAVAVVASILYAKFNPTVITFGAPRAVYLDVPPGVDVVLPNFKPCWRLNHGQHYRFVNRVISSRRRDFVQYDVIPQLAGAGASHVGHSILLGESSYSAAYLGLDEGLSRWEWSEPAHELGLYIARVRKMMQRLQWDNNHGRDELKVTGFFNGAQCLHSDECSSGRCNGVWERTCEAKLPNGSRCNESSDCESGKCNWLWKCA